MVPLGDFALDKRNGIVFVSSERAEHKKITGTSSPTVNLV
jgi:hypothetical protein